MAKAQKAGPDQPIRTFSPRQIRAIRWYLGMDQKGLAEMLGIGVSTLYEWERGRPPKNDEIKIKVAGEMRKLAKISQNTAGRITLRE